MKDKICKMCRYRHGIIGCQKVSPCKSCHPDTFYAMKKVSYRSEPLIMKPLYRALDWLWNWLKQEEDHP